MRLRADRDGPKPAFRFLQSGEVVTRELSYLDLDRRARAIAVGLGAYCQPGDRALLVFPAGLDFLTAFFGCLYAGVVAVPAYPPRPNESIHRLRAIGANAGARVALTTSSLLATSRHLTAENLGDGALPLVAVEELPDAAAADWRRPDLQPDTLAFLQYTSGSTGQPKGVMLSHAALLANQAMISRVFRLSPDGVQVTWLPLFHDMGLIGMCMQTLYIGSTCLLMPPTAFLQKPVRWLELISRERAHCTGAPNFAFDLCVQRTTPEERAALDLSSLRVMFNGSEPLHAATLERFAEAFAPAGFRREMFLPCYGMAEASLLVTGKRSGLPPVTGTFAPGALAAGRAVPTNASGSRTLVSSGRVATGLTLAVVDPATQQPCADGDIGEIWVSGPSLGSGYWANPELSESVFGARLGRSRRRYLRTGDLGFLREGELFVTGRLKDLIIVRGRNHYPQDLEATAAAAHPGARAHGTAAFAVERDDAEQLVIVQEIERTALRSFDVAASAAAIREALVREHDVAPSAIAFVRPATLPKTSSGKLQRSACRDQFTTNTLELLGLWRADDAPVAATSVGCEATTDTTAIAVSAPAAGDPPNAAALQAWLVERVAAALHRPASAIDAHAPLQSLGLDSLGAVALSGELESRLGRAVSPTIVYDFPTIARLAAHFVTPAGVPEATASARIEPRSQAIAIIGAGCRFPGNGDSLDSFWQALVAGLDAVGEIPSDRWDVDAWYDADPDAPGRMYVRRGAFLRDVAGFDPELFGISPREAAAMDPQHRVLLELAWEALEDAAIAPTSLAGSATGVFIGLTFDDYARLAAAGGELDAHAALGSARSVAAARLAYHLGLHGPAMVVDTLCSSSLVAVHLALQSLRSGESRVALAGGANLMLAPDAMVAASKLRALSPRARCAAFDAEADGYARGEGAGLVVLKRLDDAIADGDPILAVIRGSAVNQDGRSNGLTAPSANAQEALLRRALADAHAEPGRVAYVEAHGTGTILGDPIECDALARVFAAERTAAHPLRIGTVKTNLGHLEAAAGIAGLLKGVLVLRHGTIPPNLHFHTPNPYIPWDRLPLRVADTVLPLPAPESSFVGVSSFGLSGTNAHVVLARAPERVATPSPAPSACLFTLSGHSVSVVPVLAARWADFIDAQPDAALEDLCWTANVGRAALAHRFAVVVGSRAELAARLRALQPGDVVRSDATAETRFAWPASGGATTETESLLGAAEAFRRGAVIDWATFPAASRARRLGGAPRYAFQRRRYWLNRSAPAPVGGVTPLVPLYSIQWEARPLAPFAAAPRSWALFCPDPALASALTDTLQGRGQTVVPVTSATDLAAVAPSHGLIVASAAPVAVFALARSLARQPNPPRLWLFTRQAVATGAEMQPIALTEAPLAGFARAFALEHAAAWGGLFDAEIAPETTAGVSPEALDAFVDELLGNSDDDVAAWRRGSRRVPRLVPAPPPAPAAPTFRADRTYLITGGTGGLGLALAAWLVDHGARHLLCISRRGASPDAQRALDTLTAQGAVVRVERADVTSPDDLGRVLGGIAPAAPLAGVFHAAGVSGYAPLTELTGAAIDAVLAPKVDGARALDAATRALPLDHFVLFSSISAVWGSARQTHYAAANAYLDALAYERRRAGLPALSVAWGPWDETGMAVDARDALRRIGLQLLPPRAALATLGRLLAHPTPHVVAAEVDWSVLRPVLAVHRPRPLLDRVAPATATTAADSVVLSQLRAADPTQRDTLLAGYLQQVLGRVLGFEPGTRIDPAQGFFALGMDSLMAVELKTRLEADLALTLPGTVAFDRATLAALQEELSALLFPGEAASSAPAVAAPARPAALNEPIAIVGLGCRFPGGVDSPEAFWQLLSEGRHGIRPVPRERWDAERWYHPDPAHPGTIYAAEFGLVEGVDRFDAAFFSIYPREAAGMDPQQRLLLETAWEALERAGLANERLRGSATGVFVGASTNDYAQLILKAGDASRLDAHFGTGNALNALAGRLAYVLGLRGPTLVTDTACSSSLVALHQACQSLRTGECRQAIAAGVNLILTPEPSVALSRARMLSPESRCKTFDASADGYVRGEGCGVVVLKRLADAETDGDPIVAVIRGSAVNQDGAGSGFTVPNATAQQELIARALAQAARSPDDLDYVEAHGTGTPLGDPIELNALAAVVGRARPRPLFVGSVKTNLGHLESAAGVAGVIKAALALQHGVIPPHLHFSQPNPHVAWHELPLRVPRTLTPWPDAARPRLAGVSAFGFTGTNAHVVLEAAPPRAASPSGATAPHAVPLSARTPDALRTQRRQLAEWLVAHPDVSLADVARTLGRGRSHFACREVHVLGSVDALRAALAQPVPAEPAPAPRPIAWICSSADDIEAGHRWVACGVTPSLVLAESGGLIAAGVLAGIIAPSDAALLAADPAAIGRLILQPPRVALAVRGVGRIDDTRAAAHDWWARALAGQPGAGEPCDGFEELRLTPDRVASLHQAAALYRSGHALDWSALTDAAASHLAGLPTYPFQRARHWIEAAEPGSIPTARATGLDALLGRRLPLPGSREIRFGAEYCAAAPAFLDHHRLFGRVIAPAAQHVGLFLAAAPAAVGATSCTLRALAFPAALRLADDETRAVQLVLAPDGADGTVTRLLGAPATAAAEWIEHATATLHAGASVSASPMPAAADAPLTTGAAFYAELDRAGYTLGPSFRWVADVSRGAHCAVATLAPAPGTHEPDAYPIHPGLLDSCFQVLGWYAGVQEAELAGGGAIYIPASIDEVRFVRRPASSRCRVVVEVTEPDHARTHRLRGNLQLYDEAGALVLEVIGFEARRAPRSVLVGETAPASASPFFRVDWREIALPASGAAAASWGILGDSALAAVLAERLRQRGHSVAAQSVPPSAERVLLCADSESEFADASCTGSTRLLAVVHSLLARERPPRLVVVTRGAQCVPGDRGSVAIGASALLGLARIVALEHPELHPLLVDLEANAGADEAAALEGVLTASTDEPQLALRGARILAARLVPADAAPRRPDERQRLTVRQYGDLDTLALAPAPARSLAPHELEIEVRAAGVNFRDVLGALGMMTHHLESLGIRSAPELPLGGECAGVVTAVGAAVSGLTPGQAVIAALATGSMATHVVADSRFVVPKPAELSFAEAATLPVVYLTAHHALRQLAHVRRGERVLIHAAAGGVGIAAIHVARELGAEVYATASPAKWPLLRALGVRAVANSRNTGYAGEFPPVDVVLNSLTGEHIPCSLDLLAPGGRFVEIGKLGIWSAEAVAARRPDVAYHTFDLVELSRQSPTLLTEALQALTTGWSSGGLPPLPSQVYPLAAAGEAFRFMAQAKHVGKIVLVRPPVAAPLRRDGVYLVTGGLGGVGLAIAQALARRGAGTLVLASRRPPTAEHEPALAALRSAGARVAWLPADFNDPTAAAVLVRRIAAEFGPLRGVFHAAGVLDDGLLAQQTPERLAAVYRPKADAAWALHEATRLLPVEHFVLFSSLAAVLGSPGQGTYVAANAALDALAHHRQRLGLPALSIGWGPWAEAGMAARLGERERARLAALGLTPFTAARGTAVFEALLAVADPHVVAADLDVAALRAHVGGATPPLLRDLGAAQGLPAEAAILETLRALPAADRVERLAEFLAQRLAEVLGLGANDALPRAAALSTVGIDSLMAVELKGWVAGQFGVELPMEQIPTLSIDALAARVLAATLGNDTATVTTGAEPIENVLRRDATLPADFAFAPAALAAPRHVLLTGATGFLGAFLLHELLQSTDVTVHCLVRAGDDATGRRRIAENLAGYGLPAPATDRIVVVRGDLAAPRFGLSADAFAALASAVDTVIHNGAWLNFFYAYETLRPANVDGTREVLRLAGMGATKPVHYVSTAGVFYSRHYHGQVLAETDAADHCEGHALGYSQTKWVAERLVLAAGERGLPVSIHRAPFITGDTHTGAWNSDDFICRLVRGIVSLGAMPELAATMDIVPVDYVARAIVRTVAAPAAGVRRLHLCARQPVPWTALAGWLGASGYPVALEPYAQWLSRLGALRGTEHPLAPFVSLFLERPADGAPTVPEVFLHAVHSRLDGTATAATLAGLGVPSPTLDATLWRTYLTALTRSSLLPTPTP